MSDNSKRKRTAQPAKSGSELLDELDSIKELLDEELNHPPNYNSVAEIASVKEYLRIKKAADGVNLSVEAYLAQHTGTSKTTPESEAPKQNKTKNGQSPQKATTSGSDDDAIPILEEAIPTEDEIPLLVEVTAPDQATGSVDISLKKVQQVVDIIVNHRLERLRPQLKKEIMAELLKLLPHEVLRKK